MSNKYKQLSLTDHQLIHRLSTDYGLTQKEIADIIGCNQGTVSRSLSKEVPAVDFYPMPDNGCYRAAWYDSEENGLSLYQQSLSPYEDPTFDAVAEWEEGED